MIPEASILVEMSEREEGGTVARVLINNPRKLNTLNSTLMGDFVRVFEELAGEKDMRAVVLTGVGEKAFIGGADIHEMAALNPHTAREFITHLHRCCNAVRELPVPVIARIQGYALGAGLELAASCDLRIAAESAQLGMPEVKLGIPSVIEAALLPSLVGWGRAREILLLGETFSAAKAADWGLIQRAVPPEELDTAVEHVIQALLNAGPNAIRLQKKLMRAWEDLPLREAVAAGVQTFTEAWQTDEPRLRMQAFQKSRQTK